MSTQNERALHIAEELARRTKGRSWALFLVTLLLLLVAGFCVVVAGDSPGWLRAKAPWIAVYLQKFNLTDQGITSAFNSAGGLLFAAAIACVQQWWKKQVEKNPVSNPNLPKPELEMADDRPEDPELAEQHQKAVQIAHAWKERADHFEGLLAAARSELRAYAVQTEKLYGQFVWRRLLLRTLWMVLLFALGYTLCTWLFRRFNPNVALAGEAFGLMVTATFGLIGLGAGTWLAVGSAREAKLQHQLFTVGLAAFLTCFSFTLMSFGKGNAFHTEVFYQELQVKMVDGAATPAVAQDHRFSLYQDKNFHEMLQVLAFYLFGCPSAAIAGASLGRGIAVVVTSKPTP